MITILKCTEDFAISIVNTLFFHNHDLKPNEVGILAHTKYALKYQLLSLKPSKT